MSKDIKDEQMLPFSDEYLYHISQLFHETSYTYAKRHTRKHTYGTDDLLSVGEVHLLTQIADNPGITASELASYWDYTKGSISHVVKSLTKKGLLVRERASVDSLHILLSVTEKGQIISDAHKASDILTQKKRLARMLEMCPEEDVKTFYRMFECFYKVIRESFPKE